MTMMMMMKMVMKMVMVVVAMVIMVVIVLIVAILNNLLFSFSSILQLVLLVHQHWFFSCVHSCCVCPAKCVLLLGLPYSSLFINSGNNNVPCW